MCGILVSWFAPSVLSILKPFLPPSVVLFVYLFYRCHRVDEEGDPLTPRAQGRVQAQRRQGLPCRRGGEVAAKLRWIETDTDASAL